MGIMFLYPLFKNDQYINQQKLGHQLEKFLDFLSIFPY